MSQPQPPPKYEEPAPSTGTSRSLLERVRANEPAAWDRLVTLYAPLVLCWCRRWELQEADTADIFQEVFQAVATHIATFRKERSGDTFRGWLHTVTHNKVQDHFRRQRREPGGVGGTDAQQRLAQVAGPADEDASAVEQQAERSLYRRALAFIRAEFEERTWQAFWRTAVEGRPAPEVGVELTMSPGAVRVAKSRVLQRLRQELGDGDR
ncbi:MAG: sigma-70 family RNA polymerase sigma factor [Gemmataceae bacterium]|nr:sigma-70 family RNA polymerase sigma factor [Gemmataceae bacterium]